MPSTPQNPGLGPSPARQRVLERVRQLSPVTAMELAEALGVSDVAARQHLAALEEEGLVRSEALAPTGPGRPAIAWATTAAAREHLPDGYAELTIGLIDAIEDAVGRSGLDRVVEARAERQAVAYESALAGLDDLAARVHALAGLRTDEGYMAEVRSADGSGWLLIEHHCPICAAAQRCRGLCAGELDVFRRAVGAEATIDRIEHALEDGARCVYRIAPIVPESDRR